MQTTLRHVRVMSKEAIRRAVDIFDGSPARLARAIGEPVKRQNVEHWLESGRVPTEYCAAIEAATQQVVRRQDLRQDDWRRIWPELAQAQAA